jgi:hypothetical protein
VLLCEGEAFARNCGIWFKIKTDSKRSEEEERMEQMSKRSAKSEDTLLGTMSQPQQDVSMVSVGAPQLRLLRQRADVSIARIAPSVHPPTHIQILTTRCLAGI